MYTTLISVSELAPRVADPAVAVVDCRYRLDDAGAGEAAYAAAHIPGAVYVHLGRDLSGPPVTDHGRHPLPAPAALSELFSGLGIDGGTQVVAYDDAGGMVAARLWWMLRYMGHDRAAVLDGGFGAWTEAGLETRGGPESRTPARFAGEPRREWLVVVDEVAAAPRLVDARDPARFRGESEPLDPAAGHIPGARNHHFGENLAPDGHFLAPGVVRERLLACLGETAAEAAVFYCGSGVSACHNLLALAHAGLPPGRLYVGSWSEWCRDPDRPVATGG